MGRQVNSHRVGDALLSLGKSYYARLGASMLGALLGCRWLNAILSRRASNNSVSDHTWNWEKEIVLLTGGSGGIGSIVARKLGERKVKVIVVDVHPPKSSLSANQYYYQVDITSSEAIQKFASQLRNDHGDPTVLINNAGVGNAIPIIELPEAALRKVFDVNIISHFLLLKEFLPSMIRANHGHIVTVASMASFAAQAQNVDYAATKAGALALHEGLGQEIKHTYRAPKLRTT
ncbi:hypothetical protein LTR84_006631 [Exophiala bonariae]|uniref:Uncharacterized protein n=1 Tax=Exophiala bonariae TaxID=1690606 RepID=A0AAV9N0N6_9EURO|nr:hypothetical protein LTR84_006631 [Exophiala bonariae]